MQIISLVWIGLLWYYEYDGKMWLNYITKLSYDSFYYHILLVMHLCTYIREEIFNAWATLTEEGSCYKKVHLRTFLSVFLVMKKLTINKWRADIQCWEVHIYCTNVLNHHTTWLLHMKCSLWRLQTTIKLLYDDLLFYQGK